MRKYAICTAILLGTLLSGCARLDQFITGVNSTVSRYAPIVGRDLIMVANIVVQAECSPALSVLSRSAGNVLHIVAPNTKAADRVTNALGVNQTVADQLCPFLRSISASVGDVPSGTVSQIVTVGG